MQFKPLVPKEYHNHEFDKINAKSRRDLTENSRMMLTVQGSFSRGGRARPKLTEMQVNKVAEISRNSTAEMRPKIK